MGKKTIIIILQSILILILCGVIVFNNQPQYFELMDIESPSSQELIEKRLGEMAVDYKIENDTVLVTEDALKVLKALLLRVDTGMSWEEVFSDDEITETNREKQFKKAKTKALNDLLDELSWISSADLILLDNDESTDYKVMLIVDIVDEEKISEIENLKLYFTNAFDDLKINEILVVDYSGNKLVSENTNEVHRFDLSLDEEQILEQLISQDLRWIDDDKYLIHITETDIKCGFVESDYHSIEHYDSYIYNQDDKTITFHISSEVNLSYELEEETVVERDFYVKVLLREDGLSYLYKYGSEDEHRSEWKFNN